MIRAYTQVEQHAVALREAAAGRGYALEVQAGLERGALLAALPETELLVVDLTRAGGSVLETIRLLDSIGSDDLPPVLYLLGGPGDVATLSSAENIVIQDFTFAPVTAEALATRLDVLLLLGSRRRLALESAITDRLTGLYNRKYFLRRLEEEMYRAQRYGYRVGCILADVDFALTDGELSEDGSSQVIKAIGEYLTGRLRRTDVLARFRFSEFGVLLPDIPVEDSLAVARDLQLKIEALSLSDAGRPVTLRAAVGHLCFPIEGTKTALDVVDRLEDACLQAKSGGAVVDVTG
jgi:diguanylate cyclase (GGDEF)-like protein